MRFRAESDGGAGDVEGIAAVFDQPDMIEPRIVADQR